MQESKLIYSRWMRRGGNTFIPTDNSTIIPKLDPGVYILRYTNEVGWYLFKKEIHLDELIEFPNSVHKNVLSCIQDFWKLEDKFREYGYAFKRGILLHGQPGCGKSCTINIAMKYMVEELKGIVIDLNTDIKSFQRVISEMVRIIEPDRPIFVIIEDIENYTNTDEESALLNLLDGIDQLDRIIYIATTNYIERLKARIINRPSRFDRRIEVPLPDYNDRLFYFQKKLHEDDLKKYDIKKWAEKTQGLSVAHLAELIKSVVIFGNSEEDTFKTLNELNNTKDLHSSNYGKDNRGKIGFFNEGPYEDDDTDDSCDEAYYKNDDDEF